jgi:hypothetical protein
MSEQLVIVSFYEQQQLTYHYGCYKQIMNILMSFYPELK